MGKHKLTDSKPAKNSLPASTQYAHQTHNSPIKPSQDSPQPTRENRHKALDLPPGSNEPIDELLHLLGSALSLDNADKIAIDIFLSRLPEGLNPEELNKLSQHINSRISEIFDPHTLSEHNMGHIISRLYILRAEESRLLDAIEPPASSEAMQALNAQLDVLRSNVLGPVLKTYFYPTDKQMSDELSPEEPAYLINKLTLEGLSDLEIETQITERFGEQSAQHLRRLQSVENNWLERYLNFSAEKQLILEAGLADEDKAEQIKELFKTHYSEHELSGAIAFDQLLSEPAATHSD